MTAAFAYPPEAIARRVLRRLIPRWLRLALRMRVASRGADPEWPLVPLLCEPHLWSVDVGANQGLYTWKMSSASRAVLAFEPYPPLAARLCADFGANVQVQTCALSDYEGQALLAVPQVDGKDLATRCTLEEQVNTEFARRTLRVRVRRLDSFGLTALGFVKIDVEGHELAVLRGAPLTLARNQPTILVSCEERHVPGDRERIRVMLQALDYSGWFVDHGRLRPLAEFDVQMHQRPELAKAPGAAGYTGDYIFNFIYVHPSRVHVLERLRSGLRQVPHGNLVAGRLSGGKASVHDPVPGGVSLAQMAQGRFRAVPRR